LSGPSELLAAICLLSPNSPDLNPLNYYLCGVLLKGSPTSPGNVTSLRTAIEAAFADIEPIYSVTLQRACERFKSRIKAVIEADGGYIE